ncbi:MAG TPA: hypothetical protein VNO32_21085 [Candidatus Acidoferrum sp.]|nr:hypothetical protein [Candidatus Acidoferrum sp.]
MALDAVLPEFAAASAQVAGVEAGGRSPAVTIPALSEWESWYMKAIWVRSSKHLPSFVYQTGLYVMWILWKCP